MFARIIGPRGARRRLGRPFILTVALATVLAFTTLVVPAFGGPTAMSASSLSKKLASTLKIAKRADKNAKKALGRSAVPGPMGAAGPKGDPGAPGAKGDTGPAGPTYSGWAYGAPNVTVNQNSATKVLKLSEANKGTGPITLPAGEWTLVGSGRVEVTENGAPAVGYAWCGLTSGLSGSNIGRELKVLANGERSPDPFTIGQNVSIGSPTVLNPEIDCVESGNPQGSYLVNYASFSFTISPAGP